MKRFLYATTIAISLMGIVYSGTASLPKPEPKKPSWALATGNSATPSAAKSSSEIVPADKLAGTISNFENGRNSSTFGSGWQPVKDDKMGGTSKVTLAVADGGASGTAKSLHVVSDIGSGSMYPYSGAMLFFGSQPMRAVNLSGKSGLQFYAKGKGRITVYLFSESLGKAPSQTTFEASPNWTAVTIPWRELGVDGKDVQAVLLSGTDAGPTEFNIDEVKLQ
jgi:hypothetical protein